MFAAILTNRTVSEDLNQHLPVLGLRLCEINKSTVGSDEILADIWDQMVRFFLGTQTAITSNNEHGFIDVSTVHMSCSCVSSVRIHEIDFI
jgi:hypothetical protein